MLKKLSSFAFLMLLLIGTASAQLMVRRVDKPAPVNFQVLMDKGNPFMFKMVSHNITVLSAYCEVESERVNNGVFQGVYRLKAGHKMYVKANSIDNYYYDGYIYLTIDSNKKHYITVHTYEENRTGLYRAELKFESY